MAPLCFFACALKFKERACAKNAESHIRRNCISTWEFVKSSTKKYTKMAVCTNNCGTEGVSFRKVRC